MNRRAWLTRSFSLAALAGALPVLPALARTEEGAGGMTVIAPVLTDVNEFIRVRMTRIDPVTGGPRGAGAGTVGPRRARLTGNATPIRAWRQPPTAYVATGARLGVPVWLLFGVALQESQLLFGHEALPWPWTLNVGGRGERHASYEAARDALGGYLRQGLTNVDCGPMQVNWRAHSGLLVNPAQALDPYHNLSIGARILADNYAATSDWPRAVGLYHTGSFSSDERRDRAVRYVAGVSRRLSRHGLTLAQAANLPLPGAVSAGGTTHG